MNIKVGCIPLLATVFLVGVLAAPTPGFGQETGKESISALETELSQIEQELDTLEKKVNGLLEDLVDPKITSVSLFFSARGQVQAIPLSLEIRMDDHPLVTRQLSEADRLLLIRGGALEIYSGILAPGPHNLNVRCQIQTAEKPSIKVEAASAVFKFEPHRASANFVEISLSRQKNEKAGRTFGLAAKYWSKGN